MKELTLADVNNYFENVRHDAVIEPLAQSDSVAVRRACREICARAIGRGSFTSARLMTRLEDLTR